MMPTECVKLVKIVKATFPAMKLDEYTSDAWELILADVDLSDALTAVQQLARRERFIGVSDIRTEVAAIRKARIDALPEAVPDADPDDVAAYLAAIRSGRQRVASGLKPRPVRALISRAFHAVPRSDRAAITAKPERLPDRVLKVLGVDCPTCGVSAGDRCVIPESSTGAPRKEPHASRRHRAFPAPEPAEQLPAVEDGAA